MQDIWPLDIVTKWTRIFKRVPQKSKTHWPQQRAHIGKIYAKSNGSHVVTEKFHNTSIYNFIQAFRY
jgi:hypothetical protein